MKFRFDLNIFKYFILFMFLIEPKTFYLSKPLAFVYAIANVSIFFFYLIKNRLKFKSSIPIVFWIATRIYLLFIMIINNNIHDIDKWGYLTLMVVNLFFIITTSIEKNETKEMLRGGRNLLAVYLLINLFTLVFYKHGLVPDTGIPHNCDNDFYFLGIKVTYTSFILTELCFLVLDYFISNDKKSTLFILLIILLNLFISKVSTGIVSFILISIFLLVYQIKKYSLNLKISFIISSIANYLIVVLNIQNLFSFFIVDVLHKSLSLSNRIYIWSKAIEILKSENTFNLIFGNGIFNDGSFVNIFNKYLAAHNTWIQNIYEYGVIGTLLFIFMLLSFEKRKVKKTKEKDLLEIIIFAILIATISSGIFSYSHIYIPLIFIYYIDYLVNNKSDNKYLSKKEGTINEK